MYYCRYWKHTQKPVNTHHVDYKLCNLVFPWAIHLSLTTATYINNIPLADSYANIQKQPCLGEREEQEKKQPGSVRES